MSIRLDPRRVGVLKRLAGETGMRPGDLVRQWVEERLDAARHGVDTPDAAKHLADQLTELVARVAALEAATKGPRTSAKTDTDASAPVEIDAPAEREVDAEAEAVAEAESDTAVGSDVTAEAPDTASEPEPEASAAVSSPSPTPAKRAKRVSASPSGPRVALHDEMIAVITERGPMSAGDLATAIAERGRYLPPRSGKSLDAAMVSQRVSNPVYRARFTRNEGRIGLANSGE